MHRQLPNQLTLLRLVLAAVFFLVLNQYRYDTGRGDTGSWGLYLAVAVFIVAALTDALDGYLARRWKAESTFGRIMDPFCDKVLIIGAFIYLAGPRFVDPDAVVRGDFFTMSTGVYPWMVVVILARELLVTGIRGELEGVGTAFASNWWGKAKMILQSIAIPIVLIIVQLDPAADGREWLRWPRDVLVYATVLATLLSGIPYITRCAAVLRDSARPNAASAH